jgi:hypothetical protein
MKAQSFDSRVVQQQTATAGLHVQLLFLVTSITTVFVFRHTHSMSSSKRDVYMKHTRRAVMESLTVANS